MAKFITTTLMDSYVGGPHITETQIGLANQATFGPDDYVLGGGRESEAQVLTNNSIRIFDAVYCIQGRRDVIPASGYTDVTIANGTQGMNRNDIIVRRYEKDESSEIESTEYAVIKGIPNAGEALDPEVTIGDIRTGATLHEMKLYRVKIEGLNITAVEPLFNILKNMAVLQQEIAQTNKDLSNKVAELNKNIPRFCSKTTSLTYSNAKCMKGKAYVGEQFSGCFPQLTLLAKTQQPYTQTNAVISDQVDSQGNVNILAYGSGYVNGHVLTVAVFVCK